MAEVLGVKELNDALQQLEPKKQFNALRNAARAALKPSLAEAKRRVPRGDEAHKTYKGRLVAPGFAAESLNINTYKMRRFLVAGATLGTKKEAYYVRQFLERGTANTAPQPWLRPTYEATRRDMEATFKRLLREQILKQARKVKKPRGMNTKEARSILGNVI